MKSGVISARIDAAYIKMIEMMRLPGESDGALVRRALDTLALATLANEDFGEYVKGELGKEEYGV